jgi:hypothetical protein
LSASRLLCPKLFSSSFISCPGENSSRSVSERFDIVVK